MRHLISLKFSQGQLRSFYIVDATNEVRYIGY